MSGFLDPVVLFFILGALAGVLKSDLKVPEAFYHTLSIYLLLAIGIKGGIELFHADVTQIIRPATFTILAGITITLIAAFILQRLVRFEKHDVWAIAGHYGSVSAVTFALILTFLNDKQVPYEEFMTVLLVTLEIPAIAFAIFAYKSRSKSGKLEIGKLVHEVFFGKSILLLLGGLGIGYYTAFAENEQLNFFFFDLFKGFLAIFMLEMGIVASARFADLKKVGLALILFGIGMPMIGACVGISAALVAGLSVGGTAVLATMCASASYIAAPAAMRIAIPQANPTFSLTAALGITFPFNIIIGVNVYYQLSIFAHQLING
jgi:hypothetical protein